MTRGRAHFERQLTQLDEDVLQLGSLARQAVGRAVKALMDSDADLAREVIAADVSINRLRYDVETECYGLLATEQPVAGDLRAIVSALTMATDLERIADHGKKIARVYLRMLEDPRSVPLEGITRLAELALAMLDRALRAFTSRDTAEAKAICLADDQADVLYKQIFNGMVSYMVADPRRIGVGTHLLQIAHELERVADRATNIAERIIYTVTGELMELNV